jgi:NAD(P)-dependent dehydrogenase (short-subunit alcohol dehydrogenase family)
MMARCLAGAGAKRVYILGRRKAALASAASQHECITPIECDVTSKSSLQAAVDTVTEETGYINLLIANSGILGPTNGYDPDMTVQELRRSLFDDVAMDDFTQAFNVNVTGAFFSMTAFLELLDAGNKNALKGGFGAPLKEGSNVPSIQSQVVINTSVSAYSRHRQCPPAYTGSKSAIAHLAKHASTNLAKYEIRVNALAPGCK